MRKVRPGRCYRYRTGNLAHAMFPPPAGIKDGDKVCISTCVGCPAYDNLGLAAVEKDGVFQGLVAVKALEEIPNGKE